MCFFKSMNFLRGGHYSLRAPKDLATPRTVQTFPERPSYATDGTNIP